MPTIEYDLAWLANICDQANANETRRHAHDAIARIRAAFAHLEEGARLLRSSCGKADNWKYELDVARWIKAERLRQAGKEE